MLITGLIHYINCGMKPDGRLGGKGEIVGARVGSVREKRAADRKGTGRNRKGEDTTVGREHPLRKVAEGLCPRHETVTRTGSNAHQRLTSPAKGTTVGRCRKRQLLADRRIGRGFARTSFKKSAPLRKKGRCQLDTKAAHPVPVLSDGSRWGGATMTVIRSHHLLRMGERRCIRNAQAVVRGKVRYAFE